MTADANTGDAEDAPVEGLVAAKQVVVAAPGSSSAIDGVKPMILWMSTSSIAKEIAVRGDEIGIRIEKRDRCVDGVRKDEIVVRDQMDVGRLHLGGRRGELVRHAERRIEAAILGKALARRANLRGRRVVARVENDDAIAHGIVAQEAQLPRTFERPVARGQQRGQHALAPPAGSCTAARAHCGIERLRQRGHVLGRQVGVKR